MGSAVLHMAHTALFSCLLQDAHIIRELDGRPGYSLYAVFDGHGGQNAAKFAAAEGTGLVSVLTKKCLVDASAGSETPEALGEALRRAFLTLDQDMREHFELKADPNERSGCTAVAVLVTPTHIITANAGDSRALLARKSAKDKDVKLSEDHKPWKPEEKARIEAAGGCVSMKRVDGELAVSRSLGDFQFKQEDISPEQYKVTANPEVRIETRRSDDEFIVLACDGIWDVMENDEVIKEVTSYCTLLGEDNPMLMCEELMQTCLDKHSRDNMSVIIALLQSGQDLVNTESGKGGIMPIRQEREAKEAAEAGKAAAEDN